MGSYAIAFRKKARDEFNVACDYSQDFCEQMNAWLSELAAACESKADNQSTANMADMLDEIADASESLSKWKYILRKTNEASFWSKVRAFAFLIRNRKPPFEIRTSIRWFHRVLGVFNVEAHVYYEVDHVRKRIVIAAFSGLPQQDL